MKYVRMTSALLAVSLIVILLAGGFFVEKRFLTDPYRTPRPELNDTIEYKLKSWPIYVSENELIFLRFFNLGVPALIVVFLVISMSETARKLSD